MTEAWALAGQRLFAGAYLEHARLFFQADPAARYERLVFALSGARAAGVETLGMLSRAPKPR
ncbi:hypothetical protein [Hyalangium gracile]|uniref:hypothetical protein n=1 Tax=Hyalangium gracile TaxID=394092 RepID=UPI001CC9448E|nr:hypothetical protein [Hyalangium gracile]